MFALLFVCGFAALAEEDKTAATGTPRVTRLFHESGESAHRQRLNEGFAQEAAKPPIINRPTDAQRYFPVRWRGKISRRGITGRPE